MFTLSFTHSTRLYMPCPYTYKKAYYLNNDQTFKFILSIIIIKYKKKHRFKVMLATVTQIKNLRIGNPSYHSSKFWLCALWRKIKKQVSILVEVPAEQKDFLCEQLKGAHMVTTCGERL